MIIIVKKKSLVGYNILKIHQDQKRMIQQLTSVNGILVIICLLFIGKEGRTQIDTSNLAFYLNDVDLTSKELIIRKAVKGFNIGGYLFEINDTKLGIKY